MKACVKSVLSEQELGQGKMFCKKNLILLFTAFVICESGFVDDLEICNLNDAQCQRDQSQYLITVLAKTGIPELGIQQIDPLKLSDVSKSVLNFVDVTLTDRTIEGMQNCIVDKFVLDIKNGRASMEHTCDVIIKGHYKIQSSNRVIESLFGGQTVRGDGNGKIKIEKLHFNFNFVCSVERRNGDIYFKFQFDKTDYSYDIGNLTFIADNLYLGSEESSKLVMGLLNQNWRILMDSFGKPVMDKSVDISYDILQKLFGSVPAKKFTDSDLSIYVKDEL